MDVRCEQCKTLYELDDARVSESGTTVRCTTCGHVFRVRKKILLMTEAVPEGGEASAVPPPVVEKPQWRVRNPSGKVVSFRELTSLQKWIVERKFGPEDQISLRGDTWKRLGDIAELQPFFGLLSEVDRVRDLEARLRQAELPAEAPPLLERELIAPEGAPPTTPTPIRLEAPLQPPSQPEEGPPFSPVLTPAPFGAPPAFSLEEIQEATRPQPDDQPMPTGPVEPQLSPDPDEAAFTRRAGLGVDPDLASDDGWEPRKPSRSKAPIVALVLVLAAAGAAVAAYFQVWLPAQREQKRLDAERAQVERGQRDREQRENELRERERRAKEELLAGLAGADAGPAADAGAPSEAGPAAPSPPRGELTPPGRPAGTAAPVPSAPTALTSRSVGGVRTRPARLPEGRSRTFAGWMAQGDREHDSQRLSSALVAYDRAVGLEPSRPEGHVSRGVVLLEQGNSAQAIAAFQRALELNPRYAVAQYWLGEGYRRSGRKSDAVRAFGRYLELSPEGAEAAAARRALQSLEE